MLTQNEVREYLDTAAKAAGFEHAGEPCEGFRFEYRSVREGESDLELSVAALGTGKPGSLSVTPKGYGISQMAFARRRAQEFAEKLPGYYIAVVMPAPELEQALPAIREAALMFGLELDLKHGFDGHANAIGMHWHDALGRGSRVLCLRFEGGRFVLHYWGPQDRPLSRDFREWLARRVNRPVDLV
jgi:hypothetical protein